MHVELVYALNSLVRGLDVPFVRESPGEYGRSLSYLPHREAFPIIVPVYLRSHSSVFPTTQSVIIHSAVPPSVTK